MAGELISRAGVNRRTRNAVGVLVGGDECALNTCPAASACMLPACPHPDDRSGLPVHDTREDIDDVRTFIASTAHGTFVYRIFAHIPAAKNTPAISM